MLKPKIEKILNEQVEHELSNVLLYEAMGSWAEVKGLPGCAKWFYAQADEEKTHMQRFVEFINERYGTAVIPAEKKPTAEFGDVCEAFKAAMKREVETTEKISNIVKLALDEGDYITFKHAMDFIEEQQQEEASIRLVLDRLKLLGKDDILLYHFDNDIFSMRG